MKVTTLLSVAAAANLANALPQVIGEPTRSVIISPPAPTTTPSPPADVNPWVGKDFFVNPTYAAKLKQTIASFLAKGDILNAARTKTVQGISTFVWVTTVKGLQNINAAVNEARHVQRRTGKPQIVPLVLYNLPSRDCAAGESAGEFQVNKNGLALYKSEFVDDYARKLKNAKDLTFAVVIEPDSLGNLVTNMGVPLCKEAAPAYVEGIAYAIAKLQAPNIHLYIDAAHGGWLGWDGNLPLAAVEFARVVDLARKQTPGAKIRGFATNVSNFNPYIANPRANYTEWSKSYDESNYAQSLTPHLEANGLPAHFIIDQGRAGLQNQRETWGEWCNIKAGYGIQPTTETNSSVVDAIVWIKPAGESDGACGPLVSGTAAPGAGLWWNEYAEQAVANANPVLAPAKL